MTRPGPGGQSAAALGQRALADGLASQLPQLAHDQAAARLLRSAGCISLGHVSHGTRSRLELHISATERDRANILGARGVLTSEMAELRRESQLDLEIGGSECTRLAGQLEEALRGLGPELDDAQFDEVISAVVRAWLSGFRFGVAEVIAQADREGIHLLLAEDHWHPHRPT